MLTVSQVTAGRKNCLRYELAGGSKALAWNSESPNALWIGERAEANRELLRDPSLLDGEAARFASYPGGHNEGFPDTFKQLYRAVYTDVLNGARSATPLYATFEDGHHEVLLCEAIARSHKEQRLGEGRVSGRRKSFSYGIRVRFGHLLRSRARA